jgi:hypothetical protein
MPVVGFLQSGSPGATAQTLAAFHSGLKEAGYVSKVRTSRSNIVMQMVTGFSSGCRTDVSCRISQRNLASMSAGVVKPNIVSNGLGTSLGKGRRTANILSLVFTKWFTLTAYQRWLRPGQPPYLLLD